MEKLRPGIIGEGDSMNLGQKDSQLEIGLTQLPAQKGTKTELEVANLEEFKVFQG
jgi:hypothetical protein